MLPVMLSNSCEAAVDENSPFLSAVLLPLGFLECEPELLLILRAPFPVLSRSCEAFEVLLRLNLFDLGFLLLSLVENDSDIIGAGGFLIET